MSVNANGIGIGNGEEQAIRDEIEELEMRLRDAKARLSVRQDGDAVVSTPPKVLASDGMSMFSLIVNWN